MRAATVLILMVLLAGCDGSNIPTSYTIDLQGQPSVPAPQRYEIKNTDVGIFLLDTEQGRVWRYTLVAESNATAWIQSHVVSYQYEPSGNDPFDFNEWLQGNKRIAEEKKQQGKK